MRKSVRRCAGIAALRTAMTVGISTAHSAAPITLGNAARRPSPAVSMMRRHRAADPWKAHSLLLLAGPHRCGGVLARRGAGPRHHLGRITSKIGG